MDIFILILLHLIQLYNDRTLIIAQAIQQHAYLATFKWLRIKQWKKKLQRRRRRGKPARRWQPPRNRGDIRDYDVLLNTGMMEDDFKDLFVKTVDGIQAPRRR
jgi:hypothetical protein